MEKFTHKSDHEDITFSVEVFSIESMEKSLGEYEKDELLYILNNNGVSEEEFNLEYRKARLKGETILNFDVGEPLQIFLNKKLFLN